eukprot:16084-Pleurochrysis_carterae.AAC.2
MSARSDSGTITLVLCDRPFIHPCGRTILRDVSQHGVPTSTCIVSSTAILCNWSCIVICATEISHRQCLYFLANWDERLLEDAESTAERHADLASEAATDFGA